MAKTADDKRAARLVAELRAEREHVERVRREIEKKHARERNARSLRLGPVSVDPQTKTLYLSGHEGCWSIVGWTIDDKVGISQRGQSTSRSHEITIYNVKLGISETFKAFDTMGTKNKVNKIRVLALGSDPDWDTRIAAEKAALEQEIAEAEAKVQARVAELEAEMLASPIPDAERERALEHLRGRVAESELTLDRFGELAAQVWGARTRGELAQITGVPVIPDAGTSIKSPWRVAGGVVLLLVPAAALILLAVLGSDAARGFVSFLLIAATIIAFAARRRALGIAGIVTLVVFVAVGSLSDSDSASVSGLRLATTSAIATTDVCQHAPVGISIAPTPH